MEPEESQPNDHLREKIHPSMLVVTIRGMCSAALRKLLRIVKDQIEERGVAIIVSNKKSTNWKKTSVKTLLREKQLRYIDVEEMRVVTNDKHIPEQINTDKSGERCDEWIKSWKIWKR